MAWKAQMIYLPLSVCPHCLILSCLFTLLPAHLLVYHIYGSAVRNETNAGWSRAERALYDVAK